MDASTDHRSRSTTPNNGTTQQYQYAPADLADELGVLLDQLALLLLQPLHLHAHSW